MNIHKEFATFAKEWCGYPNDPDGRRTPRKNALVRPAHDLKFLSNYLGRVQNWELARVRVARAIFDYSRGYDERN